MSLKAQIDELSLEEKLQLVFYIWDGIGSDQQLPMPEWHKEELLKREAEEAEDLGEDWQTVKARVLASL